MFRKIDGKEKWDNFKHNALPDWLIPGDIPGDLLNDLRTTSNNLSVFEVDDSQSNLDQIISAMAANRDNLNKLDYILIEKRLIANDDYELKKTDGNTLSDVVNTDYHLNIEMLSGIKLVKLAMFLSTHVEIETVRREDVLKKVVISINNGEINIEMLKDNLKEKVKQAMI